MESLKDQLAAERALTNEKSALLIQKIYRGVLGRRRGGPAMKSLRKEIRDAWKERREEDLKRRKKLLYRARDCFGFAPVLASDTLEEAVLQRWGGFCRCDVVAY